MVTFAQAQERAERWVNGPASATAPREVRIREFDLGFVAWAEDREGNPASGGRLVIARDSGETTLWPALPVNEVIQAYQAEYGTPPGGAPAAPEPPQRVDLEATSFLLTPPEWLQEAADRAGVPDHRAPAADRGGAADGGAPAPAAGPPEPAPAAPAAGSPWGGFTDTSGSASDDASVAPPMTVISPPVPERDEPSAGGAADPEARTAVLPQGSSLPKTQLAPSVGPQPPGRPPGAGAEPGIPPPGAPGARPPAPSSGGAADLADADTAKAAPPPRGSGPVPPPPPPAPGTPAAGTGGGGTGSPPAADDHGSGYIPTRMVPADEIQAQVLGRRPGGAGPATPPPPGPPNPSQGGGVHQAATVLASSGSGIGPVAPTPPGAPGAPGAPGVPGAPGGAHTPPPPPAPGPGGHGGGYGYPGGPGGYGYPQAQPAVPMVGSGYMAVLRYRGPDGSEQRLIRRSAPGLPHPEWQLYHELNAMGVPPQQVIELYTELQCCELPGGYCARLVRETWPQARTTHTAPYGTDYGSRQAGVRHLVEHADELEQYADGPPRAAPVRAPLPQQPSAPAVGLDVIGQELAAAFGPQGVFRYDQQSVSRQGVPDIVAQTLVWSGVPLMLPPFFWAQAQPGRPIPTLAELAAERHIMPAADAGSYLVLGNDFGRQLCVQYGTAYVVAVPLEGGPGGQPAVPQFVNASVPQFARSMALLGRMWPLRYGLNPEQAGRWTTDFQNQLGSLDAQAVADPESWWSVLLEQMWDGLL
ncbi:SUKH-4 family immunity protein [Streptomyces aidingensis]|uniref:Xanthomonas XOO_2897-like deaminase n=1 Tax=Streptomyces aidingensis TaxID=910347 RepID=A0A1I1GTL2_9ACTN|nr:SUKH-4 family immunity protein [Streptomyces aidingensis]SFC14826.1 Xanthomonas XOO_2897-like deaminase [Streptomyces aidingensis]